MIRVPKDVSQWLIEMNLAVMALQDVCNKYEGLPDTNPSKLDSYNRICLKVDQVMTILDSWITD